MSRRPPGWIATALGARSLQRQLLLWLLLPQLVLWVAAAFVTYNVASSYANRGLDASLLQATRSLARQIKPTGSGLLIDFPRAAQDIIEADPNDRVYYMVSSPPGKFLIGNRTLPAPAQDLPGQTVTLGTPFCHDGKIDGVRVRMAALYLPLSDGSTDALDNRNTPAGSGGSTHNSTGHASHGATGSGAAGGGAGGAQGSASKPKGATTASTSFSDTHVPAPKNTMLVQVARSQTNWDELAASILIDTVLPLSVLICVMTLIVGFGIRAGLSPLTRLRKQVEDRAPNDLAPLELDAAPRELLSLAKALNHLLAEVQQSVQAQRRFIGNAAHQLRTPIAGLKSQTELALQATSDPDLRARLERVHESALRSARLVNQLMALARAEPDAAQAIPKMLVDLRELATELTLDMVPRALQAHIDLGMDESADEAGVEHAKPEPIQVLGAPVLIREALTNLIDNAIRYAGRGATVTVSVRKHGDQALLEVSDDGTGLTDEQLKSLFGRFFRGTQEGTGCGLGLAIVREIAERHDGTAYAQALQPRGLQVTIALPLRR